MILVFPHKLSTRSRYFSSWKSLIKLITFSAIGQLSKCIQYSGGLSTLLWNSDADSISFNIDWDNIVLPPLSHERHLKYNLNIKSLGWLNEYSIEHELLGDFSSVDAGKHHDPFKYIERSGNRAWFFDEQEKKLVVPEDNFDVNESILSLASPVINSNIYWIKWVISTWSIYQNVNVGPTSQIRMPNVTKFENRVNTDGQNLISVLHSLYSGNREFKRNLDSAMKAAFGDEYEELNFPPAADQRIQMRVRWKSLKREDNASDLSDGTLRFLLLIAILNSPSPPPLIAIDEPEMGLHPKMLPIIAEHAVEASKKTQIIFTTHSPQFLSGFSDIKPNVTVMKWEDGQTLMCQLEDDELDYWLKEYSLGALFLSGELEGMA